VNVIGALVQDPPALVKVGVTTTVATTGNVPGLEAVNKGKLVLEPDAANPILESVLVHA
jgi:hypothetical protein